MSTVTTHYQNLSCRLDACIDFFYYYYYLLMIFMIFLVTFFKSFLFPFSPSQLGKPPTSCFKTLTLYLMVFGFGRF